MNSRLDQRIQDILKAKHRRKIWMRTVAVLAAFVVLLTSLEMSSPADAVTSDNSPVIEENYIADAPAEGADAEMTAEEVYAGDAGYADAAAESFDAAESLPEIPVEEVSVEDSFVNEVSSDAAGSEAVSLIDEAAAAAGAAGTDVLVAEDASAVTAVQEDNVQVDTVQENVSQMEAATNSVETAGDMSQAADAALDLEGAEITPEDAELAQADRAEISDAATEPSADPAREEFINKEIQQLQAESNVLGDERTEIVFSESAAEFARWITGAELEQSIPLEKDDDGNVITWSSWEKVEATADTEAESDGEVVYEVQADGRLRFALQFSINPDELALSENYYEETEYTGEEVFRDIEYFAQNPEALESEETPEIITISVNPVMTTPVREITSYNRLTFTLPEILSKATSEFGEVYSTAADSDTAVKRIIGYLDMDEQGHMPEGEVRFTLIDSEAKSNILEHKYLDGEIELDIAAGDIIVPGEEKQIILRGEYEIVSDAGALLSGDTFEFAGSEETDVIIDNLESAATPEPENIAEAETVVIPAVAMTLRCTEEEAEPIEDTEVSQTENNDEAVIEFPEKPVYELLGGRSARLSEILVKTGIVTDTGVQEFLDNRVKDVAFSEPGFMSVDPLEKEEDNGDTLSENRDWVIRNILPFTGEGTLTIALKKSGSIDPDSVSEIENSAEPGEEEQQEIDNIKSQETADTIEIGITIFGKESAQFAIATIVPADGSYLPEDIDGDAFVEEGSSADAAIAEVEEYKEAPAAPAAEISADPVLPDTSMDILSVPSPAKSRMLKASVRFMSEDLTSEDAADVNAQETDNTEEIAEGRTEYQVFNISLGMSEEEQASYEEGFSVSVVLPAGIKGRDFHLYHLHEDNQIQEITDLTLDSEQASPESPDQILHGFSFVTENFSQFVLSYTVDFHYEVNGRTFEFSIPGGGYISLEHLVELLGIARDEENAADSGENASPAVSEEVIDINSIEVSEQTKKFVADVVSVEFSNPELVWVGKTDEETTVGELKEANGLDVQYSAELTEEQIEEINSSTVESGDWALISILPFTSEESLTVTMKNGDKFMVKVTDAQKPYKDVESLESGTYIIYNSFNSSKQAVFMKNDGTSYFTNTTTGTALNAADLSEFTWRVTKNSDGTYTIKSTANNIYINLYGNNNDYDKWASSSPARVSLVNHYNSDGVNDGISIRYNNKYLQRNQTRGFFVRNDLEWKDVNLTFYKIEDNPSGGSSNTPGIVLTDDERNNLETWKKTLEQFNTLTDYNKTAEVFDEDNRIYRVNITADSGIMDFYKDVDLGFVLDVSNSMKFPSSLKALEDSNGNEQQVWMTADWLNWARWAYSDYYNKQNCFYILSDPALTSTIYKVYQEGTQWKYQDASEPANSKVFDINDGTVFKEPYRQAYTLYYADDTKDRFTYLQDSVSYAIETLHKIVRPTENVDDETASVRLAYNFFCKRITNSDSFKDLRDPANAGYTIPLEYRYTDSGTQQNTALYDENYNPANWWTSPDTSDGLSANEFGWDTGSDQYVILVTDGAPNGPTMNDVRTAAANLKAQYPNVKIFTIGLSTKDVDGGSQMLYDIADTVGGVRQFYEAEKAKDLEYVLLRILQTIMAKGFAKGTITDTIDSAFYPVDDQGNPLSAGVYDVNGKIDGAQISDYVSGGKPTTAHQNEAFYTLEQVGDEWKVTWYNQEIGWNDNDPSTGNPWTGTIYVKAKEDYLGGNLIETNDGNAQIEPTGIKLVINGTPESAWRPLEGMTPVDLPVPRVNVHNLETKENSTEWTVYKGTSVTPKDQIKALWEAVPIEEVVSSTEGSAHKVTTGSAANVGSIGDGETFTLGSLMSEVAPDFDIDSLINQITVANPSASQEFIYTAYGHESGKITVRVERTAGNQTPETHTADIVGTAVEQYKVIFTYKPYTENERMNGKVKDPSDTEHHNGHNGRGTEETGTIKSTNTHTINVIKKSVEITKVDMNGDPITGTGNVAQFTIYRKAKSGETIAHDDRLPEGDYTEAAVIPTNPSTGKAEWDTVPGILNADSRAWMENSEYCILETQAPGDYVAYDDNIPLSLSITESTIPVLTSDGGDVLLYNLTHTAAVTVTGDNEETYITGITEENDVIKFKVRNDENGSLKLRKWVTVSGVLPSEVPDLKDKADGTYQFTIEGIADTPTAGISKTVTIRIYQGEPVEARVDGAAVTFDSDKFVEIPDLIPGDYVITEGTINTADVWLSSISGGKDVGNIETGSVTVTVTAGLSGTEVEHSGRATFTNNYSPDSEEDIAHIRIKKKFEGLPVGIEPDNDFEITVLVKGETYHLTSAPNDPHIQFDSSGFAESKVWEWTISIKGMLVDEDVTVTEVNGGYPAYDVETTINGQNGTSYSGTVSSSTIIDGFDDIDIISRNNVRYFDVTDVKIFMARLTDNHVLVISKNRLTLSERAKIEELLSGDSRFTMDKANWSQALPPYYYVANEGRKIFFKGAEIEYDGEQIHFIKTCQWTHTAQVTLNYVPGNPADFNFVNNYTEKQIEIDILKVDKNDGSTKLPGAVFSLRKLTQQEGNPPAPLPSGQFAGSELPDSDPTAEGTGKTSFSGLTSGYYEITEKIPPAGYVLTDTSPVYIRVENGVVTRVEWSAEESKWVGKDNDEMVSFTAATAAVEDNPDTPDIIEEQAATNAALTVGNTPGKALPNTGGHGTTLIYLFGILLTGIAETGLILGKRKKNAA